MFSVDKLTVKTSDGRNVTLVTEFTYTRKDGCIITIPAGSTSDGASTPPALWPTLPPFGAYWMAAFLHDYLYRCSGVDKAFCDETFLEAMECLGVEDPDRTVLYEGVHLLGWAAFREDREAQCSGC